MLADNENSTSHFLRGYIHTPHTHFLIIIDCTWVGCCTVMQTYPSSHLGPFLLISPTFCVTYEKLLGFSPCLFPLACIVSCPYSHTPPPPPGRECIYAESGWKSVSPGGQALSFARLLRSKRLLDVFESAYLGCICLL